MKSEGSLGGVPIARGLGPAAAIRWPLKRSSEIFELRYGKALVATERRPGNVPVYGSNGQTGTHDEPLFSGPGVVLGRKGMGNLGVEWVDEPFWVIDTAYALFPRVDLHLKFAYYLVGHVGLNHLKYGTSNPSLTREAFGAQLFPLPPMDDQRQIVAVLGLLDDKIDSNRRLAKLLEETAATLFRARFVDFVGVKELEDSEIGPIPRGWRAGSLPDVARFVNGKAFTKHANGQGRPILRIRELNHGVDAQTLRAEVDADDSNIARADDILFAWSGSLAVYRWPGQESLINQHIFKVLPKDVPGWFVHQWITEHMSSFRATAASKATTMGHIQRSHLVEARLPVPPADVLTQADSEIGPVDTQRAGLVQESRTLTEIRDALLPKLISGEIRVPDTADSAEVVEPLLA